MFTMLRGFLTVTLLVLAMAHHAPAKSAQVVLINLLHTLWSPTPPRSVTLTELSLRQAAREPSMSGTLGATRRI